MSDLGFKDWVIEEMTVKRIDRLMEHEKVFGVMSAELRIDPKVFTPDKADPNTMVNKPISRSDRKVRTHTLRQALRGKVHIPDYSGKVYKFHEANGMWSDGNAQNPRGLPEKSFVIENIEFSDILALSKFFNQEAFIYKGRYASQPLIYYLRGTEAGKAMVVASTKYGASQALAPKGKRLAFNWKPNAKQKDWQKEIDTANLGNKDVVGSGADRFAVNFGNTGFHFDFDWANKFKHSDMELTDRDIAKREVTPQRVGMPIAV